MVKKLLILALCLCLPAGAAGCASPKIPILDVTEGTYDQEFNAKLINLEEGDTAYYTLDGSEPGLDSVLYTDDGIPLTEGENLVKVIKFNADEKPSEILTAHFTISPQMPRLVTPDGVYNAEFAAKIVNLKDGYTAYYTLDGSEPNESSILYTEAGIPLIEGKNQVKAIKYDESGNSSDVLTANLTVVPYEPDYSNSFTRLHRQGNTIYYVQYVGPDSFFHYSKLCSYNLVDGSSDVVLDLDITSFIIRDGIIYYEYIDQESEEAFAGGIYRTDMHGGCCQEIIKVNPFNSPNPLLIDDWLYYDYWSSDTEPILLYRTNLNTLEAEKLSDTDVISLEFTVKQDIYYLDRGFSLYRYNMDTSENTLISSDQVVCTKQFGDEYIYYRTKDSEACIFRMRPDGTGKELLPGPDSNEFVVVGDRVYYGNSSGLHSIRIDGADHKVVCSNIPCNLQYYQGKLFYSEESSNNCYYLYCLDLATKEITMLMESSGKPVGYFVDGEVYFVYTSIYKGEAGLYRLTETGLEKLAGQED